MGITGLIPFLEKSSKRTNISEFSGGTVAIDTYCWLHKGGFFCADKIIMGQETNAYVKYCMKFVSMLLSCNIKPILVFDGRHLPAKAETEVKRKESRNANRKRAADLIKMGKVSEGKSLLRRSLDVSHKMALEVIKACQAQNVDCIVAPYEADAQLAYLNITGIADVIVTEDSDLTLFGCKKIFFKMDINGNGVLVEQDRLHLAMGLTLSNFNIDKFRYMCILSGCDYLASLPGIGLAKACKFIVKNNDSNIYNALLRLASSLNMKSLVVTNEYRDGFMRALVTFKHQLVYCPLQRKQVRLNIPTSDVTEEQLIHAGSEVETDLAWQLALGNCDPFTYEKLHDFNPDTRCSKRTNSWSDKVEAKHTSIWSTNFKIKENKEVFVPLRKQKQLPWKTASTGGKITIMKTDSVISKKTNITPKKRTFEESDMAEDELIEQYKHQPEKPSTEQIITKSVYNLENCLSEDEKKSPVLVRRSNPFKKTDDLNETSPSLMQRVRKRLPVKSRLRTVIDETAILQSKFFSTESTTDVKKEDPVYVNESIDSTISETASKENVENFVQKIVIPESEEFKDESVIDQDLQTDSGYKGLSDERNINSSKMNCTDSTIEINEVDNNIQNTATFKNNVSKSMITNNEEDLEFTVNREIFLEYRSSMFKYEDEVPDKKLKRDYSSPNSKRMSQLMQVPSSRRRSRNISKKNTSIQGQQNLLNMFGFQKKNSLQH